MKPAYRYNRSDFPPLPVRLEHMDLALDFRSGGTVDVTNVLRVTAREPLETVTLDARDLNLRGVALLENGAWRTAEAEYRRDDAKLAVRLPERAAAGASFSIRTQSACLPSDTLLEGIYKDTTPPGCPQQYMSQCQQWGFQRIAPVFDECTAKCTMTTTIEADARYTHLISNGNADRARNPEGRPVRKPGDPTRQVMTYRNPVPMAPYLFLVACGTWEVLEDSVVYPSGKRVRLEYLTPPGRRAGAEVPMQILKEAILWQGRTQEYEYPFDVYRTICMEKSNFGGMENVGNTTIVTSAALIDAYTSDARLEYAYGVTVHEFEHNQCGSEVTMETPFDMWLNEGFTVDVERQFTATVFDPDVVRLDDVDAMRSPLLGPLAVEDGGHLGRIVREGFNHPDELVDGVTYVKSAEVIRMLRLVLGAETFRRGKNLYFERYRGGNADTDGFFACFEEVSGRDLGQFKREWLYTIGYPRVAAEWHYDAGAGAVRLRATQSRTGRGGPFVVPLEVAAADGAGRDMPGTRRTLVLDGPEADWTLPVPARPAFLSLNRGQSFYGTFTDRSANPETLRLQAVRDPDGFNRVEAMRRLTDVERLKLLDDPAAPVSEAWLKTWGGALREPPARPALKAHLLRIDEQSLDRATLPRYRERYAARIRLLRAAAARFTPELTEAFEAVDTYRRGRSPKDGIEERRLKAVLLRVLVEAATPEVYRVAETHYRAAWNFSDRAAALQCINVSGHPNRSALLHEAYGAWHGHLNGYTTYLSIVASGTHEDVFDAIAREERRPSFRLDHPGHVRALYLPVAANNKMLWTDRGIAWVADTAIRLAQVNPYTVLRLIACFRLVDRLADDLQPKVRAALERMRAAIDPSRCPSVAGRLDAYLEGAGDGSAGRR
ncbi:MAG: DUF3458 domain-containing protein [Phycisphaerae bacterium]|nr:DUF3458 domain-containing protein [Phycisphaerae bacterium]